MTVRYDENEQGIFWVDGDQKGEPQKDLRHAMDDYELTQSGRKETEARDQEQRVHTGDDGAASPGSGGLIADSLGSAGESDDDDEDDEEADGR